MTRLTFALAALICLASAAPASLAPRPDRLRSGLDALPSPAPRLAAGVREQAAPAAASEYVMTERTEVLLDGKPCRYEAVPGSATIERMEVAPDRKTVVRVYFRSGR
jgi:hypothetical protein